MGRPRLHPGWAAASLSLTALPAVAQAPPQTAQAAPAHPASAGAQDSQAPSAVEQIIVTANKRRELQRRVANSVTALSGKQLDRNQQVTLQDLAADVPGLSLETDDKTEVRVVLRGLNTGSPGATVASLVDDVPTNATGAQGNASTNTPNFDTYDLQRVEVLRGPQGTLYGATAEGGLINYITNPPDPTKYAGALETGFEAMPDGGIGGSLKGFVNLPLLDGKAALRLTGWNEWLPGYVDNPTEGKTNTNSGQQYGWRASLLMEPAPDLTVRLTAERQSLFTNNTDFVLVRGDAGNILPPPPGQLALVNGLTNPTAFSQPGQNESAVYYANIAYDLGWSSLTSITAFSYAKFNNFFDVTNTNVAPGVPIAAFLEQLYGVPLATDERQISNSDKFSQELRLASDPGQTLFGHEVNWLAGGYYTHETSAFQQNFDARGLADLGSVITNPVGPTGGATLYGSLSEWALFGQVDYHVLDQFDVELGGRWSGNAQHSQSNFLCCVLYGPSLAQPEIYANSHDALYAVAPRWQPNPDTMIYGRIATGYRPGGPNIPIPGVSGLPQSYGPDRTVNYEVGWRQDFLQHSVALDVTGFWIDWKDVQILSLVDTPSGPTGVNGNAGAAVSKGVEWSMTWAPLTGLKLTATGAYADARLTVNAPGLGGNSGDFLPYVPDVTDSLTAEYSWTPADGYRAYVSGTWSYVGTRYSGFAPSGGVTESHVALPAYNTGALRAGLERGPYSAEIFAINIGDTRGITYYANQGGADQTGQATLIQPCTIGLVLRTSF